MSTVNELFAPKFLQGGILNDEVQAAMARQLGADSLRYLPVEAIARAIGLEDRQLCQACITGDYPTPCGRELYEIALSQAGTHGDNERTYERERLLSSTRS